MWKILNKLTTKLFSLKKSKGTTIVEVLIAVIIIGIVSMYGLSFFSSSYKYEVDSKDYDLILQNLVRQIEIAKGVEYQEGHPGLNRYREGLDHPRKYPGGIVNMGSASNPLHYKNFNFLSNNAEVELRKGCTVIYNYEEFENSANGGTEKFFGSTKIVCEAQWPKEITNVSKRKKITLVTYVARNWE
ncbi:MAG: prepilin-type N-terminal cleavage/methylation domain-containing protein [Elusimicrobia bacterium]|nr:prepilin-type N-terminal cleavage/methylation domain-containing protein [Elusimicrobiota bacterium]